MKETLKQRKLLNEQIRALIQPYVDECNSRMRRVEQTLKDTVADVNDSVQDVVSMEYEEVIGKIRAIIADEGNVKKVRLIDQLLTLLEEERRNATDSH